MKEIKQMEESREILHLPISWEEKGKREGREEGIREEINEGKKEVVLGMLKEGSSINFIVKVTGLDRDEIEKLRQDL